MSACRDFLVGMTIEVATGWPDVDNQDPRLLHQKQDSGSSPVQGTAGQRRPNSKAPWMFLSGKATQWCIVGQSSSCGVSEA